MRFPLFLAEVLCIGLVAVLSSDDGKTVTVPVEDDHVRVAFDGRELKLLLDTGSNAILVNDGVWYEGKYGEGRKTCLDADMSVLGLNFVEGQVYRFVLRSGSITLGEHSIDDVKFGVVVDFIPPPSHEGARSPGILGMGLVSADNPVKSLLQQLKHKSVIDKLSLSIRTQPSGKVGISGRVVLGEVVEGGLGMQLTSLEMCDKVRWNRVTEDRVLLGVPFLRACDAYVDFESNVLGLRPKHSGLAAQQCHSYGTGLPAGALCAEGRGDCTMYSRMYKESFYRSVFLVIAASTVSTVTVVPSDAYNSVFTGPPPICSVLVRMALALQDARPGAFPTSTLAALDTLFMIAYSSGLLLAGRLGDVFSASTVLAIGLGLTTIAQTVFALLCVMRTPPDWEFKVVLFAIWILNGLRYPEIATHTRSVAIAESSAASTRRSEALVGARIAYFSMVWRQESLPDSLLAFVRAMVVEMRIVAYLLAAPVATEKIGDGLTELAYYALRGFKDQGARLRLEFAASLAFFPAKYGFIVQSLCWPACVKLVGNWLAPVHHLIEGSEEDETSEDSETASVVDDRIGVVNPAHSGMLFGLWSSNASVGNIVGALMAALALGIAGAHAALKQMGVLLVFLGPSLLMVVFSYYSLKLKDSPPTVNGVQALGSQVCKLDPGWADGLSVFYDIGQCLGGVIAGSIVDKWARGRKSIVITSFLVLAIIPTLALSSTYRSAVPITIIIFIAGLLVGGPANLISAAVCADLGSQADAEANVTASVSGLVDGVASIGAAMTQLAIPVLTTGSSWAWLFVAFTECRLLKMSFLPPGSLSSAASRSFLLESSSPDEAGALSIGLRGRGRSRLPIWAKKDELLYGIYRHRVSIVVGSTGCGKSTQIPQWLDECGYTRNGYKVLLVVPRRITCVSVASRMQQEIGSPGVVGWQIRFERNVDEARNRIMVVTDGMALAYMLADPLFTQYSVIMLDDFHERSTQLDLLFSLLVTRIMPKRPKLRLIMSSATLDALSVQKFVTKHLGKESRWDAVLDLTDVGQGGELDTVVTMSVEGRCYPVATHYLAEACANYVATAVETVLRIHTSQEIPPYGADILVFLTGQEEIDAAVKLTKERMTDNNRPAGGGPLVTYALHSGLPVGLQLEALKPVARGSRKVVYSTNVAESGVTIPNIGFVVDTGFVKQAVAVVPNHHALLVTPCSKEQLVQRAGRAGRVCPGTCYRLFPKSSLGIFPDKSLPEITRTPSLSSVLLQIISLGVRNVCSLQWLTPPSARAMEAALEELRVLGFIDDNAPPKPDYCCCLLTMAARLEAIQLAALMSIDSIWARPHSRSTRERLAACKRSLGVHEGDMLTMINVYREWRENETAVDGDTDWAHRHMVHVGSMSRAAKIAGVVRRQLCQVLIDSGTDTAKAQSKVDESCGEDIEPLCRCICGAFAANAAAQVNSSGQYVSLLDGQRRLMIGQQSVLYGVQKPPNYVVYSHGIDTGAHNGTYEMIHVSQIESQWLVDVAPALYRPGKRK
ncbi:hypothetical protein FOZ60_001572 [Perkinsus olseni]|uniref:ATP-dependent RNA helicase n=2 Tax=Perkinsus olseni TaxID=32597 RepID=A0A7J6P089_PEROL|nr:hypothetical protein FOZ60_001572 [Perkinsus olseni]